MSRFYLTSTLCFCNSSSTLNSLCINRKVVVEIIKIICKVIVMTKESQMCFSFKMYEPVIKIRRSSLVSFRALALAGSEKNQRRRNESNMQMFNLQYQHNYGMTWSHNLQQISNLSIEWRWKHDINTRSWPILLGCSNSYL